METRTRKNKGKIGICHHRTAGKCSVTGIYGAAGICSMAGSENSASAGPGQTDAVRRRRLRSGPGNTSRGRRLEHGRTVLCSIQTKINILVTDQ
ncbi:hypothetical protein GDO81_021266 [Engystomops pustulosus]|uniref:Uncharacterized protein n=1 Tax=Engystomops pustulosus TaxID=76066 RepID=A0AAV6ZT07_ENGPU|nr:hypothetical protein GDO81_021266 [Engystomops pustulosus]